MSEVEVTFPMVGIKRVSIGVDGNGIRSLVVSRGCPLSCKMCLNKPLLDPNYQCKYVTVASLYEQLKIDDLYFKLSRGGVTFGGGEPMLHSKFIKEFSDYVYEHDWTIDVETSLNVPTDNVYEVMDSVDEFFVDIKDMNLEIYRSYTGKDNSLVIHNLKCLLDCIGPDSVVVRIPKINGFNTVEDIKYSIEALSFLGVKRFDIFSYKEI